MFTADGCWNLLGLSQEEGLNLLKKYLMTLKFGDSEDVAKVIRKEFYLYIRNTLMAMRRKDIYATQNDPAFSNWGRGNMTQLAEDYSLGGEDFLDETLEHIFHSGWESEKPEPCIIGFDENAGTSKETAIAIYNAPSHEDGIEAEYWYLHYKFGRAREDWDLMMQKLVKDPENNKTYDVLDIRFPNNMARTIYFDISEFYRQ
jgi:hypothetical protein